MPDTEEWALYLTSHLLCWKAWCVIVGEGVGGGGPGMRKPGPLPQMSLEDNGKPDIKADRLQSCVSQQQEDPFVLVRGSGRAPGGGGIGSKWFRHYKGERKCQALGQQRELLTQSRLVGVWGKEIGDVGRPSRTCSVSSGVGGSCQTLGSQIGNAPRQQWQPAGLLFRASLGDPGQSTWQSPQCSCDLKPQVLWAGRAWVISGPLAGARCRTDSLLAVVVLKS